jgi:hypothetical protein
VVQGFGERDDRVLRRAVDRRPGRREPTRERRHDDHVAAPLLDERRQERARRMHHPQDVRRDHEIDPVGRQRAERTAGRDPGVRDDHVGPAVTLEGDRRERIEILADGDVASHGDRIAAARPDPRDDLLEPVESASRQHHACTRPREPQRRRLADAR